MMKQKYSPIFLILFFAFLSVASQENKLSALTIPQEFKENANAIIRHESTIIEIKDIDQMKVYSKMTITILNKIGHQ